MTIDTPQIIETPAQQTAMIRLTVPRSDIQKVMGPGIQEVYAALAAQKIAPDGPWMAHHLRMDPAVFDFEICVPINSSVVPTGRVQPGEILAATVARTVYQGPYEGLGSAWGEFEKWIAANGHTSAADLWEIYATGPESGSDPNQWRTELNRPLVTK